MTFLRPSNCFPTLYFETLRTIELDHFQKFPQCYRLKLLLCKLTAKDEKKSHHLKGEEYSLGLYSAKTF